MRALSNESSSQYRCVEAAISEVFSEEDIKEEENNEQSV